MMSRIAAVVQSRGRSQIAILDADGKQIDAFGGTHSVNSGPSWSNDGRRIYFSSERSGSPQIYVAAVTSFSPSVAPVTDAATGVFSPEVSPDGTRLASLLFSADGYHVGVAPLSTAKFSPPIAREESKGGCTTASPRAGLPRSVRRILSVARYRRVSRCSRVMAAGDRETTDDGTALDPSEWPRHSSAAHYSSMLCPTPLHENSAWLWYRYADGLLARFATQNFSH